VLHNVINQGLIEHPSWNEEKWYLQTVERKKDKLDELLWPGTISWISDDCVLNQTRMMEGFDLIDNDKIHPSDTLSRISSR